MNFYQSNHYDTARNTMNGATNTKALDSRLDKLFTPRTFFERWRYFNAGAVALSYVCNLLSCVTAFTVLSFVIYSAFNGVFPNAVALALSVFISLVVVAILEVMKRFATANFLRRIFQEKRTNTTLLTLVLLCCSASIFTSFQGAKYIPDITHNVPTPATVTTNTDSIKQFYAGLITAKQKSINSYLPKVETSGTARKTVAALEGDINALNEHLHIAINQANEADQQRKNDQRAKSEQLKTAKQNEGYTLGWVALGFELVFLLCLVFNWAFYWQCYVERAAISDKLPTTSNSSPPTSPPQPDQQRPTVVQGFLNRKKQEKQSITSAVNTSAVSTKYTRHCDNCEVPYIHKVHNQKFCSEKCRVDSWQKKTGKTLRRKQKGVNTNKK